MIYHKVLYRKANDSTEYTASLIATSQEEIQRHLVSLYGELQLFRLLAKEEIHAVLPSVEKAIYIRVKREIDNAKEK